MTVLSVQSEGSFERTRSIFDSESAANVTIRRMSPYFKQNLLGVYAFHKQDTFQLCVCAEAAVMNSIKCCFKCHNFFYIVNQQCEKNFYSSCVTGGNR